MFAFDHINGFNVDNASAVSSNFWGGAGFSTQYSEEKNHCAAGVSGVAL